METGALKEVPVAGRYPRFQVPGPGGLSKHGGAESRTKHTLPAAQGWPGAKTASGPKASGWRNSVSQKG